MRNVELAKAEDEAVKAEDEAVKAVVKDVKFEGHGHVLPPVVPFEPTEDECVIFEQKLVIDKETLQPVVEVTHRDLDKEIQSYKDECGIAFILRQIASGRLSIDQIRDDGKSGHDLLGTPTSINEASMINDAANSAAQEEADKLGIQLSESALQALIQKEIKKAADAKAAAAANQEAK